MITRCDSHLVHPKQYTDVAPRARQPAVWEFVWLTSNTCSRSKNKSYEMPRAHYWVLPNNAAISQCVPASNTLRSCIRWNSVYHRDMSLHSQVPSTSWKSHAVITPRTQQCCACQVSLEGMTVVPVITWSWVVRRIPLNKSISKSP